MSNPHAVLKFMRQIHLYIGIFISPALLFFALTGALQTFSLHETTRGSDYKPPAWIVTLGQLHKKQTTEVPVRKPAPAAAPVPEKTGQEKPKGDRSAAAAVAASADAAKAPTPAAAPQLQPAAKRKSHLPMKIFFLLVAIGLFTSTLTGLYMAYRFGRNKWVVTALLLAGIVVPVLLLPF